MNPKEKAEELLGVLIPFAEQLLVEHGEFFPFAGRMAKDGQFNHVAGYAGEEQPPSDEIRRLIEAGLREQASRGECDLAIVITNVSLTDQETGDTEDAIHAAIEHRAGYFADVFFPYSVSGGSLEYGDAKAQPRTPTIFEEQV